MIKSLDGLCIHADGKGITDPLFKHIIPHNINQEVLNFRAELDKETDADKDIARKTKALVDYAAHSQRAINKNLWVPDTQFFTKFACDTLVNVQVKDLSGYMRVLNVLTKNLAESLPADHPIISRLTANQGKNSKKPRKPTHPTNLPLLLILILLFAFIPFWDSTRVTR